MHALKHPSSTLTQKVLKPVSRLRGINSIGVLGYLEYPIVRPISAVTAWLAVEPGETWRDLEMLRPSDLLAGLLTDTSRQ
ncbi:hypothetical protein V2G26_004951 [Clonostachys chloroleuca]